MPVAVHLVSLCVSELLGRFEHVAYCSLVVALTPYNMLLVAAVACNKTVATLILQVSPNFEDGLQQNSHLQLACK